MFVLCALSKNKKAKCWTSADEVQTERKRPIKKSPRRHRCLSLVRVVCCQAEVSATADHSSGGVLPTVMWHCV
jgi:hypothetical protein